jgi:hypothetical protein
VAAPARLAVTFLFSRACPSHEEGLASLHRAARDADLELDLTVVEVRSDAQAAELRFPGSPTYLVRGRDPFAAAVPEHAFAFDACRAFARPGGRVGPLPHHDDLVAALKAEGVPP